MNHLKKLVILGLSCSALSSFSASAWEIDFDTYIQNGTSANFQTATGANGMQGQIVDSEYTYDAVNGNGVSLAEGLGATFTGYDAAGQSNPLVVFDTDNPTGGDSDIGAPFENINNDSLSDTYAPGNVLVLHEETNNADRICNSETCTNPDDIGARPAGHMEIAFNKDVFLTSIDFFDVEYAETSTAFRIVLLDDVGQVISNSQTGNDYWLIPDTGGDNTWDRVSFNVGNVRKMEVYLGGSGAIDNIVGRTTPDTNVSVPEPSTLVLFGLAAALMGRRRFVK